MEYRKGAHTVSNIQYHFVWVTKYRYEILTGDVKTRVRELIRQICQAEDVNILKGHVSNDHIHILVSSPPKHSPSYLMQKIKGRSSRKIQQEYPHLRKRYWGKHMWARGFFCTTVGQMTDEMVKEYIAGHLEKSGDDDFTLNAD